MKTSWLLCIFVAVSSCGGEIVRDPFDDGDPAGPPGAAGDDGAAANGGGGGANVFNVVGECKKDEDCELQSSCCDCRAVRKGTPAPDCDVAQCLTDRCTVMGITAGGAQCMTGQCALPITCKPSDVECSAAPPTCLAGELPMVQAGCWGPCVPVTSCHFVPSCASCDAGSACVVWEGPNGEEAAHCVNPPAGCASGCQCLADKACNPYHSVCSDDHGDGSAMHCAPPGAE